MLRSWELARDRLPGRLRSGQEAPSTMNPAPTPQRQDARTKRPDGRANHLWLALRKAVPGPPPTVKSRYWQAMRGLFPWTVYAYPGAERGAIELAQGKVTPHAIGMWRKGARKPPRWMWELIAAEADRRIAALEHVRELAKKEAGN